MKVGRRLGPRNDREMGINKSNFVWNLMVHMIFNVFWRQ